MVDTHGGITVAILTRCRSEKTLCGVATWYRLCIKKRYQWNLVRVQNNAKLQTMFKQSLLQSSIDLLQVYSEIYQH